MLKKAIFLFCSSLLCFTLQAQNKYSNAFLEIGVDARAMAMGNNVVGHVNGAYAGYWNPAGITNMEGRIDFGLMHAEYFAGIANYDYLGAAYRLDEQSSVALSIIRFGVDNILNTTQLIDADGNVDYDRITKFSAADYGFLFSYSRAPISIENLTWGANFKIVYRQIGDFADAYGFGLDAGIQYQPGNWRMGAALKDVTTTVNAWTFKTDDFEDVFEQTGNELPENGVELTIPRLIIGGGHFFELGEKFTLLAEADMNFTFDAQRNSLISSSALSGDIGAGIDLGFQDLIFLRGGIHRFQKVKDFDGSESLSVQPTVGLGIHFKMVSIDYALTNIGSGLTDLYSNVFSIRVLLD
ncbi:MAG: PorV/PorQ family protein [Schleiferiaceae bacterium]|nr:PorV/PorQ family protein [Schleiferiaceae bacterium]